MSVIVYGSDSCPACELVKDYLKKKGVLFEYRDALRHARELQAIYSKRCKEEGKCEIAIPVIKIDKKTIIGFSKRELKRLL